MARCTVMMRVFLLQWLKSISKTQLLEKDDPVYEWRERIFKQFEAASFAGLSAENCKQHSNLPMLRLPTCMSTDRIAT